MKKIILIYILACMCTCFFVEKISCQATDNSSDIDNKPVEGKAEIGTALPVNTSTEFRNAINIKAVQKFVKTFKGAQNVSWFKAVDGGYVACFINDSIQVTVAYNPKGSWVYTLKKYAENNLPAEVRAMVKSSYFDYAIIEVTEISQPHNNGIVVFSILIKYAKNFKRLQICNKQMEIASDFTKQ